MNPQLRFLTVFLSVAFMAYGQAPTKRYLYMSTPDASQKEGRAGNGILIFDIDNGHKFVRRINVPIFEEGIRGFAGNLKTHSVYYSTSNRRVGAFDLCRRRRQRLLRRLRGTDQRGETLAEPAVRFRHG